MPSEHTYRIIIQNPDSNTVIRNVQPGELGFWRALLEGSVHGEIRIVKEQPGELPGHQVA